MILITIKNTILVLRAFSPCPVEKKAAPHIPYRNLGNFTFSDTGKKFQYEYIPNYERQETRKRTRVTAHQEPKMKIISIGSQFHKGSCQKKKPVFFGRSLPNMGGWGGWLPNKVQTPQNPPKSPRKSPFSTQISPFVFPNLTKTLGWVGG